MKALVTGGAGFIGSHVAKELLDEGYGVIILDDLSGGFKENIPGEATFIEGSINDKELIKSLFEKEKFDYVFHLAAYAAEGLSHFIRYFNYENNLLGSINLINESIRHKIKCFVFTSSIAVYGKNQLPMKEETTPLPEDPYGISKLAVEQDLKSAHEMFGLDYIIFRPHNVYGENQNIADPYRNVIGIFMNNIMKGKQLPVFGDGEQTRAFSYIKDVSPIIAKSVQVPESYNQIFNVGSDTPHSIHNLLEGICKEFGIEDTESCHSHKPARKEVQHAYSAHEKVKNIFGVESKYSLEEGIHKMAEWARSKGPMKSQEFENIEILEGLPPSWQKITKN